MRMVVIPLYNRMRDAQDSEELVWAVILVLHHVIDYVAVAGLCSEATIKQHNDECARLRAGHPSLKMIGQVADSLKHVNKTERQSKGQFNRVVKSSDFNNFWEITDFFGKKNNIWATVHKVDGKTIDINCLVEDVYTYWRDQILV